MNILQWDRGFLAVGKLEIVAEKWAMETAEQLLEACRDAAPNVADHAMNRLATQTDPDVIDAICTLWLAKRDEIGREILMNRMRQIPLHAFDPEKIRVYDILELAVTRGRYVARQPIIVWLMSTLKAGRIDDVTEAGAELAPMLLQVCYDADDEIWERAHLAVAQLKNADTIEAMCRHVLTTCYEDHPISYASLIRTNHAPRDPHQRALFYFLSEQWEKYTSLDFDHSLLRAIYESEDIGMRKRIADKAKKSGRGEWMAIGGGRRQRRLAEMTYLEWETVLAVLDKNKRWDEIWRLAKVAPYEWSRELLMRLRAAEWAPSSEEDRSVCEELIGLAERCKETNLSSLAKSSVVLEGHGWSAASVTISPDGSLLAAGSARFEYPPQIGLWRLPDRTRLKCLEACVSCLAISPDGRVLAGGSRSSYAIDYTVRLWSLPDGKPLRVLAGHGTNVSCLAFSPNGSVFASGDHDGAIRLWDFPDGSPLRTLEGHKGAVYWLTISPDGATLASGGDDCTVRLWRLSDGVLLRTIENGKEVMGAPAFTPDGRTLVTDSDRFGIRLWSLPDGAPVERRRPHLPKAGWIDCGVCVITPEGHVLAIGHDSEWSPCRFRVWGLRDHTKPWAAEMQIGEAPSPWFPGDHGGIYNAMAISSNGRLLAGVGNDRTIQLWQLAPFYLNVLPISSIKPEDIAWAREALKSGTMSEAQRSWLEFITALTKWRLRLEIVVEDSPGRLEVGEFDIEIEG